MNHDLMAQEAVDKFGQLKAEAQGIGAAVRAFIDKAVEAFSGQIIACETEEDFLKFLAALGDHLYKAPIIIEAIDYEAIKRLLFLIDQHVLDRFCGKDWFVKVKARAQAFNDAVKGA